jgi:hypothetical protein
MKKTKDREPHQPEPELTFEQALHKIANVPKSVVDERMKQAKKKKSKIQKR